MKIAWVLVLSMVMISCGRIKPEAQEKKDISEVKPGDKKTGKESEQITVCAAYTELEVKFREAVVVERDNLQYMTDVTPAISSTKYGTCHKVGFDWVELDSKVYDENMPKPGSAEYQEMEAACASLQSDKVVWEYGENLAQQIKKLDDPQARGIIIAKKSLDANEEPRVLKCSTDFGVYQPAKVTKMKKVTTVKK